MEFSRWDASVILGVGLGVNFILHGIYNRYQRIVWNLTRPLPPSDRGIYLGVLLPAKVHLIGKVSGITWALCVAFSAWQFGILATIGGAVVWFLANLNNEFFAPKPKECIAVMFNECKTKFVAAQERGDMMTCMALDQLGGIVRDSAETYEHH